MPPRVSLSMIVRNEEAALPACLRSVAGLVDEMIVVDTGSTDRTREVAAACGAHVLDFPWCDDFAAARNESLRHATGDWVLWLDADEHFDDANREKLRTLLAGLGDEDAAYVMKQRSPSAAGHSATVVDQVRLFRNRPAVRWSYRVHEQLLPALRRAGYDVRFTDLAVEHGGYSDDAFRARKLERNLRLLLLDHAERPDDPFILFNLGWAHAEAGRPAEALPLLRRSLELSRPGDSIVHKLYVLVARCHLRLGQAGEALAACRAGRVRCPEDPELLLWEGNLLRRQGDAAGAEACWLQLLRRQRGGGGSFASVEEGVCGHRARHELALLYRAQGRLADAEGQWREAVGERPEFVPGWLGLGEVGLAMGRWDEVERAAEAIEGQAPAPADEAALLRARLLLARKDFTAARHLLGEVIGRRPDAVPPRVLLSHALLQEGTDEAAAEGALRDVLDRDPSQAESWRNLAVLLRKQGRLAEAESVCGSGRGHRPDDAELSLLHGLVLRERGELSRAEDCLVRLLEGGGGAPARRWAARHNLALVYRDQGHLAEAAAQWRALLADNPEVTAAWAALGEVYLALGRRSDAEQAARELEERAAGSLEAASLRARLRLASREYPEARRGLEEAIARAPGAVLLWVLLSYVHLQEGADPEAAERAVRRLLDLDPANEEARRNLTVLLRQRGRAAG